MNTRFRDRLLLCSAIAMGLGVSTGYPLGIVAAAGMPFACLAPGTRKAAFKSAFGYYVAALWPMVPGLDRYTGQSATLSSRLAIWVFTAILLSLPWTIAWTSDRAHSYGERRSRCWRRSSLRSGSSALPRRLQPRAIFFRERVGPASR